MEFLHGLKDGFCFYGFGYIFGAGLIGSLIAIFFQLIVLGIILFFKGKNKC